MKNCPLPGLVVILLVSFISGFAQNTEPQERIAAASLFAFGQPAASAGSAAAGDSAPTVAALVAGHRTTLQADSAARREAMIQAGRDALGRIPTDAEVSAWSSGTAVTYMEALQQITRWLSAHPDEYRQVIDRAYQLVINRPAYAEEFVYWKPFGTLPFVLLVGAIENWGQRNQPGLMVTTGTPSIAVNSRFLRTLRLSPSVANEARVLLGLPVWTDVARLRNPGYNVVAAGAADLASVGGVHFMLVGGGPLAGK